MIKEASIGSFLAKTIAPKILNFGNKAVSPLAYKATGAALGAAGGGITGSAYADEGSKTRGFITGAIAGGVVGGLGGKTLAGFARGGVDQARGKALGELFQRSENLGAKDLFKSVGRHIGDNWATPTHLQAIPKTSIEGPQVRPMLGVFKQSPVQKVPTPEGSGLTRMVGNMARNVMGITEGAYGVQGKNMATRALSVIGHDVQESRHFVRDGFRYKRSLPGQALGVTLASGAGFGAIDAATETNRDGTPASLPKKILKGSTTTLSWGLAPQFMAAKMFGYDLPKSIIKPESY
jgi:hypothetical protein